MSVGGRVYAGPLPFFSNCLELLAWRDDDALRLEYVRDAKLLPNSLNSILKNDSKMLLLSSYSIFKLSPLKRKNLPTGAPGSTTNTEVEAIKVPSSAGCNNASARG